ncbi:MAG TPA: copper-binding protein [Blastocatellia bacterium]|nr:copper-binding protein [Blastocatellia bacterium]
MSFDLKKFRAIVLSLALCALAAGCSRGEEKRYDLKGKVVHVDKRGSTVTIAHEEIPGYMEAMTMPFRLKDEWAFDSLAAGDQVTATLVVQGDRSWIEGIVFSRQEPMPEGAAPAASANESRVGDEVPDFSLVNQDGKRISFKRYRGRPLVVTFIYTRCPLPDYCPLMTERFAEIDKAVRGAPQLYGQAHLLSISVDPEFDTPEVMKAYGAAFTGSAFEDWEFATGTPEQVKSVAEYFGMQYWTEGDQIIHSLRTAVIAPEGKLFKLYHGNEWKAADILADLESLRGKGADKVYDGVGVVESVNERMATVQINHEDIKDLMPAMSMPFAVRDRALLSAARPGDRVRFSIMAGASGMVLVAIEKRD